MTRRAYFIAAACLAAAASLLDCVGDEPAASTSGDGGGAGLTCTTSSQCTTGKCVDGFCCDTDCTGQCQACNVNGHEGTCTTVTGKPHHAACTGDQDGTCAGTCDGTKTDACTYPTTTCGSTTASCAAGVAQIPATCGNGTCGQATSQTCSLGCFQDSCLGVQQIAAGPGHACALLTDGNVRCWGDNTDAECGFGSNSPSTISTPTEATALSGKTVKMLGASVSAYCAVLADGSVQCWGNNSAGQAGAAPSTFVATPNTISDGSGPIGGATFISSGTLGGRFCAIVAGGAIKCWGDNVRGALGAGLASGTTPNSSTAVDVCAPGETTYPCAHATGATFVATGDDFTCAVIQGKIACWGNDGYEQLGYIEADAGIDHPFPVFVDGLQASQVTAGNGTTCATNIDGGADCWGAGSPRIGNGTNSGIDVVTPTPVCTSADCSTLLGGVTFVSTSDESVCALTNAGAVKCWGSNNAGQLGDGTSTSIQTYAASSAIASGAVQIKCAGTTNFAVVVNGAERNVKCWGDNGTHECGDGDDGGPSYNTPTSPKW